MAYRTLPRLEDWSDKSPETGWQAAPKRQKALVVDDEPMVRTMLRQLIGLLGYEAEVAASGAEAVKIYEAQRNEIGVVILDLFMPGMDGAATFHKLKEVDNGVQVILASGNTHETCVDDLVKAGAAGVLSKPFGARELDAAITGVLGAPQG